MKKILSLILAAAMLMTAAAAFAEGNGLSSLFGELMGGSGESSEGGGLDSLFGQLMGGSDESSESGGLDSLFSQFMGGSDESSESGSLDSLFGQLMGGSGESSGSGGLDGLLSQLMGGSGEGSGSGGLSSLLGSVLGSLGSGDGSFSASSLVQFLLEKLGSGSLGGVDLSALVNTLMQKLGGGSRSSGEGGEGIDLSALLGLLGIGSDGSTGTGDGDLGALLGLLGGGEGSDDMDLDAFLESFRASPEYQEYLARFEARKVYLNEKYPELEKGDVQIVLASDISNFDIDDPNIEFGYFALANYKLDGKDLKLMNCKGNYELMTFEKQEDETFRVVNAVSAAEGDGFEASIQEMCTAFGVPFEDYTAHLDYVEFDERDSLIDFLWDHPEYERVEYMGEMKTSDELQAIQNAFWEEREAQLNAEKAE